MMWAIASIPFWFAGLLLFLGAIVSMCLGIYKKPKGNGPAGTVVLLLAAGAVFYIAARIAT